ncbi:MAG: hypothetical protein R2795_22820 [Saprospiraceae bacterium]
MRQQRMVIDGMGVVNLTTNAGGDVWCATLSLTPSDEITISSSIQSPVMHLRKILLHWSVKPV